MAMSKKANGFAFRSYDSWKEIRSNAWHKEGIHWLCTWCSDHGTQHNVCACWDGAESLPSRLKNTLLKLAYLHCLWKALPTVGLFSSKELLFVVRKKLERCKIISITSQHAVRCRKADLPWPCQLLLQGYRYPEGLGCHVCYLFSMPFLFLDICLEIVYFRTWLP